MKEATFDMAAASVLDNEAAWNERRPADRRLGGDADTSRELRCRRSTAFVVCDATSTVSGVG
jgi:hypothetical protein